MANTVTPGKIMKAWGEALLKVAELEELVITEASKADTIGEVKTVEGWLKPYRAFVGAVHRTFAENAQRANGFEYAEGLMHSATKYLEAFKEEAKLPLEERVNTCSC